MQIRKIINKTVDEFPDLKEQGFTDVDFARVWNSYENEMYKNILTPTEYYLQFLNIGTLFLRSDKVMKRVKEIQRGIKDYESLIKINAGIKPARVMAKIDRIIRPLNRKIEYLEAILYYLDGSGTEQSVKILNGQITRLKKCISDLEEVKDEYDKRNVAGNMEEQVSNS